MRYDGLPPNRPTTPEQIGIGSGLQSEDANTAHHCPDPSVSGPGQTRGRETFERYRPLLNAIGHGIKLFPESVRSSGLRLARNTPGLLGIGLRYACMTTVCSAVGRNVRLSEGVYVYRPQNLVVGSNVSIHSMCYVDASGGIEIGNDVSIAHATTIMSTSHTFAAGRITRDLAVDYTPTRIEDNVWIGAGVRIVGGVTIGEGSVIGAGAVVTRDVKPGMIALGVPARDVAQVAP